MIKLLHTRWVVDKHFLRYLHWTIILGLRYTTRDVRLHGCTNIEWDGNHYHGYVNFGAELNSDDIDVATECFVLMVVYGPGANNNNSRNPDTKYFARTLVPTVSATLCVCVFEVNRSDSRGWVRRANTVRLCGVGVVCMCVIIVCV